MKESLSRLQKGLLLALAAMVLVFGVLTAVVRTQRGIVFWDGLLRAQETAEGLRFAGRVSGEDVIVTRSTDASGAISVELTVGSRFHGAGRVEPDPAAAPPGMDQAVGVRVYKDGEMLFRGGYDRESGWLFTPEGELDEDTFSFRISSGNDPWEDYETGAGTLLALAYGPADAARGSWGGYLACVLGSLFLALYVAFPRQLFYWENRWFIRNPEPTELWWSVMWFCACALSAGLLVLYISMLWQLT